MFLKLQTRNSLNKLIYKLNGDKFILWNAILE